MTRRLRPVAVALAVVIGALGPAAPAQVPEATAAIQAMLDERARALRDGDLAAFDRTMAGGEPEFVARERAGFRRLRTLPLGEYRIEIGDEEFGDLARDRDRVPGFEETRILQASERIAFRGFDTHPEKEDVFLTVVRKGSDWTVYDDEGVEDLGLKSVRHLWDFGEIETRRSDGIVVVFHPSERAAADPVLEMSRSARARARSGWPMPWDDPIVVMIPSTVGELERILQTTFDLTEFVAFAASSVDRDGGYRLTGHRIYLHWPNFRRYQAGFQRQVLAHEFVHLATRAIAGPYITAIFDEGIAQVYGEDGGETTRIARRVRANTLPGTLVPDWYFTAGPRDDIFLAYEEAASFIGYLNGRFGRDAGARAYKALGTIDPMTHGTWRYHLDRVTVSLFQESFPALERAWLDSVRKRFS
ncbi:MAG TPA: hypothetical protein VM841_07935 [Actinomycetota bacterium]|nr:hypothetical protein [Actinomycetota bacterium]